MPSPCLTEEQVKKHMTLMKENTYAIGLRTEEAKMKAFISFCSHLSAGQSKIGWFYLDDEGNHCGWETMEKHIKNNVFPPYLHKKARTDAFTYWFNKAEKMCDGELRGGSPATLQNVMRNMFKDLGWDQEVAQSQSEITVNLKAPDQKDLATHLQH